MHLINDLLSQQNALVVLQIRRAPSRAAFVVALTDLQPRCSLTGQRREYRPATTPTPPLSICHPPPEHLHTRAPL